MTAAVLLTALLVGSLAGPLFGAPGGAGPVDADIDAVSQDAGAASRGRGTLADIRVQGNVVVPDADVVRLAGVRVGEPVDDGTVARVQASLEHSKQFAHVEVLQRFASLADPTAILLVIIVDEGPVALKGKGADARIVKRGGPRILFLPLFGYEDGYGVSYGARFAVPDAIGKGTRLSMPLTWGGDKRAALQLDREMSRGPLTRAGLSLSVSRRTNPFADADDSRARAAFRGERALGRALTIGAGISAEHVSFLDTRTRLITAGGDVVLDTRLDPMLARNAVYARAGWNHFDVDGGVSANQTSLDGRAYIGFIRQTIVVVRAFRETSDRPLPLYLQPLLGGLENLRGFAAGTAAGDTLVAGSLEIRAPLTSPLSLGKLGVRAFVDAGTAYPHGERFADQTLDRGVGGGIWFSATVVRFTLDVAHGIGSSTRVHVGTSVSF